MMLGDIVSQWSRAVIIACGVPALAFSADSRVRNYVREPEGIHARAVRRVQGCPSLAVSPKNGRLWASWYSGWKPREGVDNFLVLATSTDRGRTWKEVLVADPDGPGGLRVRDSVLWVAPDGKLYWTWSEHPKDDPVDPSKDEMLRYICLNAEEEPTLPCPEPARIANGRIMCKPIVLSTGEWLFSPYLHGKAPSTILLATRDGVTFERRGGIVVPESVRDCDEGQVVEHRDGSLEAFLRVRGDIMHAVSSDRGYTWTPAEPIPGFRNAGARHCIQRLKSGNLLLIKNGRTMDTSQGRTNLSAFLSKDDGKTWTGGLLLEARPQASYPDFDQAADGTIYIIHDRDRTGELDIHLAVVTEADVEAGRIVSPGSRIGELVSCNVNAGRAHALEADLTQGLADVPPMVVCAPEAHWDYGRFKGSETGNAALTPAGRRWICHAVKSDAGAPFLLVPCVDRKAWPGISLAVRGWSELCAVENPRFELTSKGVLVLHFTQRCGNRTTDWRIEAPNPDARFPDWTTPVRDEERKLWGGSKLPRMAELRRPEGTSFHVIKKHEPEKDGYRFLHGVALAWHKGRLYASFGTNKGLENHAGEEAHCRVSADGGRTWSESRLIGRGQGGGEAVSHGVFLSRGDELWAFHAAFTNDARLVHTRAYVLDETSGRWQPKGVVAVGGFWPMQNPVRMRDGNWIMGGLRASKGLDVKDGNRPAVAISHGDDLTQWDVIPVSGEPVKNCWGESTVDVAGACVTLTSRPGWDDPEPRAHVATSCDYGRTWTPMCRSDLPLGGHKPFTGRLSDGSRFLLGGISSDGGNRRSPVSLALSRPGAWEYDRLFQIRHCWDPSCAGESSYAGWVAYPAAVEHKGKLYVAYSNNGGRNNNDNSAELAIVPLASLK